MKLKTNLSIKLTTILLSTFLASCQDQNDLQLIESKDKSIIENSEQSNEKEPVKIIEESVKEIKNSSKKSSSRQYASDKLIGRYNQVIYKNGSIKSQNNQYRLTLQGDGNLVLYKVSNNRALWATNTVNSGANKLIMQSDGNLVLYRSNNTVVWASGTQFNGASIPYQKKGDYVIIQNDGNLVIYNQYGFKNAIWSTGTNQ